MAKKDQDRLIAQAAKADAMVRSISILRLQVSEEARKALDTVIERGLDAYYSTLASL